MADYVTTLFIPVPIDATFAYVSDFRHATWDPRVSSARRTDGDGPIGVGSTFVLESPLPVGCIEFNYRVSVYDPPNRVVLEGETWFATYRDDISFTPAEGGTTMRYDARLDLRSLLALGEPIAQLAFSRVGDDATKGIPDAVVKGTASSAELPK